MTAHLGTGDLRLRPSTPTVSGWRTAWRWARGIFIEERLLDISTDGGGHRRQVGREPEVQEDLAHDLRLGNEREHDHRTVAPRTRQGVEEERKLPLPRRPRPSQDGLNGPRIRDAALDSGRADLMWGFFGTGVSQPQSRPATDDRRDFGNEVVVGAAPRLFWH